MALACLLILAGAAAAPAGEIGKGPGPTDVVKSRGKFVPIPDSVPHYEGAYIDSRILEDVEWLADHFKIFVVEGFAGRLPSGRKVGCPKCHVENSEHKIGLALDIIPFVRQRQAPSAAELHASDGDRRTRARCDKTWKGVSRLADWAEPRQNYPEPPFRWVGYDGDLNHGCGNHLHLSWDHDDKFRKYRPSRWVMTFR